MAGHSVEFEFLGQKLTLKSQGDPELVEEAVRIAATKIGDARKRVRGAASHQVAVLALLDLAEDYVKAKRRAADYREKANERVNRLIELMDAESS